MPSNNVGDDSLRYSLVANALPDLVIGLVSVPVGFTVHQIAQKCLPCSLPDLTKVTSISSPLASLLTETQDYILGITFVLAVYVLYSVALLLIFEDSVKPVHEEPPYLSRLVVAHFSVAVFLVATVIALGSYFKNEYWRSLLIILTLFLVTLIQPLSVLLSCGRVLEYLRSSRPGVSLVYQALFTGFLFFVLFCLL